MMRVRCPTCKKLITLTKTGRIYQHAHKGYPGLVCQSSGEKPSAEHPNDPFHIDASTDLG